VLHLASPVWSSDQKAVYYSKQSTTTMIRSIENFD
jgi:hypothetical protein